MRPCYLLFVFIMISFKLFSQKYYSYPDRKLELQIIDSVIIWKDHKRYGGTKSPDKILHYSLKNDTFFIREKTTYGHNRQIIVRKGKYIDFLVEREGRFDCGIIFKKNSLSFKIKSKKILNGTNRETYNRILELHNRLIRLEIFGKGCDNPLPPVYYEHF